MQIEHQVATNSQAKSTNRRLLQFTSVIAIYYYYSPRKPILMLPTYGRWKA